MNKKKFVFLAIVMVAVIVLSSVFFFACDKKAEETPAEEETETETIEATEGLLIANSDFKVVSTATEGYPRTITDWSGAKTYSSGDYPSGVVAGAVSIDSALYSANKSAWDDSSDELYNLLTANGRYGEDDEIKHALMIYMAKKADPTEGEEGEAVEDSTHGPTSYGYTSKSFTIDKYGVYKLSVDVLTYDIAGQTAEQNANNVPGARIYVSADTYAEFAGIDTHGEWKTYVIYIEGSTNASKTLKLDLGLGKYTSAYQDGLTTGYVFFDNVVLEKLDAQTAEETFAQAKANELLDNTYVQTASFKVPNGRFEYGTMTFSSSSAPSGWSFVSGNKSEDDPAPTSLSYNAIIDVNKFATSCSGFSTEYYLKTNADNVISYKPANDLLAIETVIGNFPSERIGSNVYLLSQHLMTASSIKTTDKITIEKNKVYALSLDVFTYDVHGAGVSLILTGSDGKDIVIKGISSARSDNALIGHYSIDPDNNSFVVDSNIPGASTGEWTTYTFYILGNQYKDYSYNMYVWLGTEGTNSNTSVSYKNYSSSGSANSAITYKANGTFANGWVFVDELRLNEIAEADIPVANVEVADDTQTLDCSLAGKDAYRGIKVDLATENLFVTTASGNDLTVGHATAGASLDGNGTTQAGIPNGWVSNYDVTVSSNPVISGGVITDGLVLIDNEENFTQSGGLGTYPGLPYDIEFKTAYMIHASEDAYYEIESAPFTVAANGFYRLSLWVKTVDVKSTTGISVYLLDDEGNTISSFANVNTKDFNEYTSDWCELTFVIRGDLENNEDMHLKVTLGSGTRWSATTLTSGSAFVSNTCLAAISYSTFTGTTTGSYVKSIDRTSSTTYTFTNGSFDEYDLTDEKLDPTKALKEQTVLAQPKNWTISDATKNANEGGSSLVAGVFALENVDRNLYFDHSTQTSAVFTNIAAATFDEFYGDESAEAYLSGENFDVIAGPNVLAIASTNADKYALGYASSKFTLSSNGIYSVSVWVKGEGAEKASVFLTGEAPSSIENSLFLIENPSADWTKYTFYVEVGPASVALTLNVWLGYDTTYVDNVTEDAAKSTGAVFFDNVIKKSVSEDDLAAAKEEIVGGSTTVKVISFMTDSFDSLSGTVDSRASLNYPSNWSYSAGSNQLSSNTKSGVIYADSNYFNVVTVDGTDYVGILGKSYKVDDVTITAEEEEEIKSHYPDPEASAAAIEADLLALREQKLVDLKKANWLPVSELSAHSGKNLLVINNMEASAFTYTSSSLNFTAESYYKVSVWMRTFGLKQAELENVTDDKIGAYIELYLGTADEDGNPLIFKAQSKDEWTEYVFYVKTLENSVSSITVKLSLGAVDKQEDESVLGLTAGYAMFDDVSVEKVTEAEYVAATESTLDTVLTREVKEEESGTPDDNNDDNKDTGKKFNLDYLWWMIPTIIIGALIIVVGVIYLVKKITKKAGKKTSSSSKDVSAKKRSRYDENKE